MSKVANKELMNAIGKKVEPTHMKHYANEQTSIIRQSSIKSAVELVSAVIPHLGEVNMQEIVEETLGIAEAFEQWVKRES